MATLAQGVLFGLGSRAVGRLGELVLADLREEVVDRALAVALEDVERAGSGDLVARACGDVDAVSEAMREAIPEIVALDRRLALAGLAALPIQAGAARWYLRRSRPIYAAERAAEGARSQQLHASVTGARTIRSFRLQDAHLATITGTSRRAVDLSLTAASVRARFFSARNAAELVGLGTVLAVSYPLVQSDALTVGGATAAALYFYRLFDPVGALLTQLDTAQAAGAAMARLVGVASLPSVASGSASASVSPAGGGVRGRERGHQLAHRLDQPSAGGCGGEGGSGFAGHRGGEPGHHLVDQERQAEHRHERGGPPSSSRFSTNRSWRSRWTASSA
jgi:ATP-binding cassette subfamily C protein